MTEDPLSQSEKRQTLLNDVRAREQGSTYMEQTNDLDLGGRFTGQTPQTVVGASPVPQYPQGPAWSIDPTGQEPPLGVDVNQMQPTGEPHEIINSLGEGRAPTSSLSPDVVSSETPSPSFTEDDEPPRAA
jgi:hypothetical protein